MVDLDLVERQAREVGERRIAGAEVVERKGHAKFPEQLHLVDRRRDVVEDHALGQLELETRGVDGEVVEQAADRVREIFLLKLSGADIDRDLQERRPRVTLPGLDLPAGAFHDPGTDRQDEAGFLGQRDEVGRRDESAASRLPAQQDFGADHLSGRPHQRLIVGLQLIAFERLAQIAFECAAPVERRLHLRVEEAQGVATAVLGAVHGHVGVLQQVLDRFRTVEETDADAHRAHVVAVLQTIRLGDFAAHAVAEIARERRRRRAIVAQVFENDDELVAAEPGDRIRLAE